MRKCFIDVKSRVDIYKFHLALDQCPYFCTLSLFRLKEKTPLQQHVNIYTRHRQEAQKMGVIDSTPFLQESPASYTIEDSDYVQHSQQESLRRFLQKNKHFQSEPDIIASAINQTTVNSEIFTRIIFSGIALRHICDVRNWRLVHDIRISVNDRVILPFREGFNFTKLRICEVSRKINPSRKFLNLSSQKESLRLFLQKNKHFQSEPDIFASAIKKTIGRQIEERRVESQDQLRQEQVAVNLISSGDIDAIYIHLFAVSRLWKRDDKHQFINHVYVILQKPGGKLDIYNITGMLTLFEKYYCDISIGATLSIGLCVGGNDFIPKLHQISHKKILKLHQISHKKILKLHQISHKKILKLHQISHKKILKLLTSSPWLRLNLCHTDNVKLTVNQECLVQLYKSLYYPKKYCCDSLTFEDVRVISISK